MNLELDLQGRIKYLRARKGLSQRELAVLLGVTTQTVLKVEKGYVQPNADMLNKMIEFLDCNDPGWFLTGKDTSPENMNAPELKSDSYSIEDSQEIKVLISRIMAALGADEGVRKVLMKRLDAELTLFEEMLHMRRVLSMRREFADRPTDRPR